MLTASRGGAQMVLTYDKAGRKQTMSDPDMGNWTYNYNALVMTSQTDARGCTLTIGYDVLNRPTSKSSSGAGCGTQVNTSYTYDAGTNAIGRRVSMSVSGGDFTSWGYDIKGHVTSENKQIPGSGQFITSFTYNLADLPVTMTYPVDNEVVTFTYTNQMLLNSVIGTSTYVQSTTYDSASRMTSRALGNGLTQNYAYYAWNQQGGRLQTLSTGSLQNYTYQYDPVGNINSIADSVNSQTQSFTYDALDRLITAGATGTTQQGGYATETYGYDATTGNLASKAGVNYTAYDANHKHAVTTLSNGNSYTYDANGNMITRHVGSQNFTFAYDAENRLVSVSGDSTASFTYDADGARVKSVMDGETVYFVGGHFEKTGTGTVTKYYMAGASRVAIRKGATLSYMLADHLGSTSLVTDASGNRTSELRYKPWGESRFSFGTLPTKYTFTGQFSYMDDPSTPGSEGFGLIYFNARWVDPQLGRFAQADTIVPGGIQGYDRYAYTNNNPIRYNDPTGHMIDDGCETEGCGGSEEDIAILLLQAGYQTQALKVIARIKGIHLAPEDNWLYMDYVEHADSDPDYGWTPRTSHELYFDKNGQTKNDVPDNTALITGRTVSECGADINCIAYVMAHEATHSWIEYKLESSGTPANGNYNPVEEMVADNVAGKIGNPTQLTVTPESHYDSKNDVCTQSYGSACSDPQSLLQDLYGIDLSDIYSLVYGGG